MQWGVSFALTDPPSHLSFLDSLEPYVRLLKKENRSVNVWGGVVTTGLA
jgi:hypothetical protein